MIEFLLIIGFSVVLGGGILTVWRKGITSRRFNINPSLPAPEPGRMLKGPPSVPMLEAPRKAISREIQAELDGSPEWWNREFHKALKSSGAPVLAEIEGDIVVQHTYDGESFSYHLPDRVVLQDCTCPDCQVDK